MPLPELSFLQKVVHLRNTCLADLTEWERDFLRDMAKHLQDDDELTSIQKEKIDEIWGKQGL